MKTIEVSDQTYAALRELVQDFGETPEDVIIRLIHSRDAGDRERLSPSPTRSQASPELMRWVEDPSFKHGNGKSRYLSLLAYLHHCAPTHFPRLDGLSRGKRVQIARARNRIEDSGRNTYPEPIPGTDFWAITNLSNRSKRDLVFSAFSELGCSDADIRLAVQSIPDSGLDRSSLKFFGADS